MENNQIFCEDKPSYYAVIPAEIRYDENLSSSEKLLYGEITALSQKSGECWASNSYFANLYGKTNSCVSQWFKNLQKYGYIEIEYEKKGKQIIKRIIKIHCGKPVENLWKTCGKVGGGIKKNDGGVLKKLKGGYSKNLKGNNTSKNNTSIYSAFFEKLWLSYPNKLGKETAKKKFLKTVTSEKKHKQINKALVNYKKHLSNNDWKKAQNGSTWFNNWQDWVDYKEPQKELKSVPKATYDKPYEEPEWMKQDIKDLTKGIG